VAGDVLSIDVTTSYPWSGSIELNVRSAPATECGLAVRVPAWSSGVSASHNGQPIRTESDEDGYLLMRRRWRPGDVLTCNLDITPRLTHANRRIDALRGAVAVERGPLVYCFEQADQQAGLSVEDLAISSGALAELVTSLPGVGPTVAVQASAVQLPPAGHDGLPYLPQPDTSTAGQPATAVAIPYFQWDNRDGRAMRIWMPLSRSDSPTTSEGLGR
jgi:DUF1680 family protein